MPTRAESTKKDRALFGARLTKHRRDLLMTQEDAAVGAAVSISTYRLAEQGKSLGFKMRRRLEEWMRHTHNGHEQEGSNAGR